MKSNWYKKSGSGFWGKLFRGDKRVMSSEERIAFLRSISGKFDEFRGGHDPVAYEKAKALVEDPQTGVDVLELILEDGRLPETIKLFIFGNPNMDEDFLEKLIDSPHQVFYTRAAFSPKATDKIFNKIMHRWMRSPTSEDFDSNYWRIKYAVMNPVAPTWFLAFVARSVKLVHLLVEAVKDNHLRLENMSYDVLFGVVTNRDRKFVEESKEFKDRCLSLIKDRAIEGISKGTVSYDNADFNRINKMMNETAEHGGNVRHSLMGVRAENTKEREEYLSELTSVAVNPNTPEKVLLMMIENSLHRNIITSHTYFPKLIGMNNGASPAVLKSLITFDERGPVINGLDAIEENADLKRLVFSHPNFTRELYDVALKSIFENPRTQIPHVVARLLADSKFTTKKEIEYILYKLEEMISGDYIYSNDVMVQGVATPFVNKFIHDSKLMGIFNDLFKKGMDRHVRWGAYSESLIVKRLRWVKSKFSGTPKAAMVVEWDMKL